MGRLPWLIKMILLSFLLPSVVDGSMRINKQLLEYVNKNNINVDSTIVVYSLESYFKIMIKGGFLPEINKRDTGVKSLVKLLGRIKSRYHISRISFFKVSPIDTTDNILAQNGYTISESSILDTVDLPVIRLTDKDVFYNAILPKLSEIRKEYKKQMKKGKKGLTGKALIEFIVSENGKIESLVIKENQIENEGFVKKILKILKKTSFETDHRIVFQYPLIIVE